ncbi:hypothetical protein RSAG8_12680, partial [Rhizoctonia solani AG-8 WAC10335]
MYWSNIGTCNYCHIPHRHLTCLLPVRLSDFCSVFRQLILTLHITRLAHPRTLCISKRLYMNAYAVKSVLVDLGECYQRAEPKRDGAHNLTLAHSAPQERFRYSASWAARGSICYSNFADFHALSCTYHRLYAIAIVL